MNLQHLIVPTRETRNIDLFSEVCFWSDIQVLRVEIGTEDCLPVGWTLTNTTVHGGPTFCRKIAKTLAASVAEPAHDFLSVLPVEYANRTISLMKLYQSRSLGEPKFIKPVNDKHFRAAVYTSGSELAIDVSLSEEAVLVSDPVEWDCEYRMFIRDFQVKAFSVYRLADTVVATEEQQEQARAFCEQVLADKRVQLPRAVVLDVGYIRGAGWSVVEANAAVMSSVYDCDPIAVLEVLEYGLVPLPEHNTESSFS